MPAERIRVRGIVQGVGFRPFVWRLAQEHAIAGSVSNDAEGVIILAQGSESALAGFAHALESQAPPLARVEAVERSPHEGHQADGFEIVASSGGETRTGAAPDAATCADCLDEITGNGRRRGYAFTNCTNCGPRFSIMRAIPYDRRTTTMAPFKMCGDCAHEYTDPADRRFHAQPIACPACGPQLWFERGGAPDKSADPLAAAAASLVKGQIVAIKGLGGFHLACDARDERAVSLLRERKRRPAKPFAVMVPDLDAAETLAVLCTPERDALKSAAAPIVLAQMRAGAVAPSVAPGQSTIGLMLPMTPLHHLLMRKVDRPLVMTSGNLSGEPQAIGNDEARTKLAAFVDAFLLHDREIARRLDDPVVRVVADTPRTLRHGRGTAPATFKLGDAFDGPPVTAFGGQMKSAICLLRGEEAVLSHHLGDLETKLAIDAFKQADADYHAFFDHRPEAIACDLHADFASSRHAQERADQLGVPLITVQHHHAHVASAIAQNRWTGGPVVGVVLDGLGLGPDGTVWGGEVLLVDGPRYQRLAHLAPVPLIGGEAAQREPWRNTLAQLAAAGLEADDLFDGLPAATVRAMLKRKLNVVETTAAGRLFDAVSFALDLCAPRQSFEGEAAMAVEAAATGAPDVSPYPFDRDDNVINPAPMWKTLLDDKRAGRSVHECASAFQRGLAAAMCSVALDVAKEHGVKAIALSGGCFQNAALLTACFERLKPTITVLAHSDVPANDGGLALGQSVTARAILKSQLPL